MYLYSSYSNILWSPISLLITSFMKFIFCPVFVVYFLERKKTLEKAQIIVDLLFFVNVLIFVILYCNNSHEFCLILYNFLFADDAESLKSPKRGLIQSIFCCWRRPRTKTTQNGLPENDSQTISRLRSSNRAYLLPPIRHQDMHKKCMVIDLDETLVHSSFKVSPNFFFKYLIYL